MAVFTIYGLHDPTTGVCRYIGQTKQPLLHRLAGHRNRANRGDTYHVCNWWRSLPAEPIMRVIQTCETQELADILEDGLMSWAKFNGARLTNIKTGGLSGTPGPRGPFSAEHKAKLRAANKGKKPSLAARQASSTRLKGKPSQFLGKHHSEASKQKLRAAALRQHHGGVL